MRLNNIVLAFAALLCVPAAQAQDAAAFDAALADVRQMVAEAPGDLGLVVAVTDRDRLRLVVAHGYADIKARTPATSDTLFAIGSISKSFTAIALMQLWDEGRFDPDAPIARYLPELHPRGAFPPITGASLLSHGSGLPNYRADLASMRYTIAALNDFELRYPPGAHFWYSNIGYQLLGYAAERIDGTAFPALLQRRLLDPLGMKATSPQIDARLIGTMAASYTLSPVDGRRIEAPWFDYQAADGAIVTTGGDLAAYARMLLNCGAIPGGRILSQRAFARLTTPVLDGYAFGLNIANGGRLIEHAGTIAGFMAMVEVHLDDGFGIAVLGNGALDRALIDRIVARLSLVSGAKTSALEARVTPPLGPVVPGDFTGRFAGAAGRTLTFSATAQGGLALDAPTGAIPLVRIGRDSFGIFVSPTGPRAFTFFRDDRSDRVTGVASGFDWYVRPDAPGTPPAAAPARWRALVGRYKAHGEEGSDIRLFVRAGRLHMAMATADPSPRALVEVAPNLFRLAIPDYAPERIRLDTPIEGRMQRLQMGGETLYRVDLP